MNKLIVILMILISGQVFCQSKSMYIKNAKEPNSDYWYQSIAELCKELDLVNLSVSPYAYHFRLWSNAQAVEIWQNEKGEYKGLLTNWTKEYTPDEEQPTKRTHLSKIDLNSLTVSRILDLISSTRIEHIPDQESIKAWKQGFDGITYLTEKATTKEYFLKSYWTPTAQDSLQEALIIQDFTDKTLELVNAQAQWKKFASTIPFECYYNGGPSIACKILTKRDKRKYKQERNNYRQHHPSR